MEKLFDICSDSTPVEEGLTGVTVQGAFLALKMVKVEHEILFRFLHQLLKGKSSMAKAFGNAQKTQKHFSSRPPSWRSGPGRSVPFLHLPTAIALRDRCH